MAGSDQILADSYRQGAYLGLQLAGASRAATRENREVARKENLQTAIGDIYSIRQNEGKKTSLQDIREAYVQFGTSEDVERITQTIFRRSATRAKGKVDNLLKQYEFAIKTGNSEAVRTLNGQANSDTDIGEVYGKIQLNDIGQASYTAPRDMNVTLASGEQIPVHQGAKISVSKQGDEWRAFNVDDSLFLKAKTDVAVAEAKAKGKATGETKFVKDIHRWAFGGWDDITKQNITGSRARAKRAVNNPAEFENIAGEWQGWLAANPRGSVGYETGKPLIQEIVNNEEYRSAFIAGKEADGLDPQQASQQWYNMFGFQVQDSEPVPPRNTAGTDTTTTPPAANSNQAPQISVGTIVQKGNKKFRYKGGNPDLATSYEGV